MWCTEFMSYTYVYFNRGSRRRRVISRLAGNIRGNGSLCVVYMCTHFMMKFIMWIEGVFEYIHVSEISGFHYIDVINWATDGSVYDCQCKTGCYEKGYFMNINTRLRKILLYITSDWNSLSRFLVMIRISQTLFIYNTQKLYDFPTLIFQNSNCL